MYAWVLDVNVRGPELAYTIFIVMLQDLLFMLFCTCGALKPSLGVEGLFRTFTDVKVVAL